MQKLKIIYEDKDILVVNKPPNLLTISDGISINTLYAMARAYVKKQHKSNKIFIVHRLDKETSGLVIFAKNIKTKTYLQANWASFTREYIAIVEGVLKEDKGVIKNYLKTDKTNRVYVSKKGGDYAISEYQVLKRNKDTTSVLINIQTGKRHQIRVGFSSINHPILGDKLYGHKDVKHNRLALHAYRLKIKLNNQDLEFICEAPKYFEDYLGGKVCK